MNIVDIYTYAISTARIPRRDRNPPAFVCIPVRSDRQVSSAYLGEPISTVRAWRLDQLKLQIPS